MSTILIFIFHILVFLLSFYAIIFLKRMFLFIFAKLALLGNSVVVSLKLRYLSPNFQIWKLLAVIWWEDTHLHFSIRNSICKNLPNASFFAWLNQMITHLYVMNIANIMISIIYVAGLISKLYLYKQYSTKLC